MRNLLLALVICVITTGANAQNLISNGSFELPGLPNTQLTLSLTNGSTFLPGWTVIDDNVGEKPYYAQRPNSDAVVEGTYGLALNQGSGIRTTFRAQAGTFYELSFWLRPGQCIECQSPAPLAVAISGRTYTIPLTSGWTRPTIQFFATNSVNTLEIFNPSSSGDKKFFGVDDVTVTKVNGALLKIRMYPGVIIEGFTGQKYEIQAAEDAGAATWVTLTNITLPYSPFLYVDVKTNSLFDYPPQRRIYRAVQVP